MRLMSIASGSSGNCIYLGSNNTHILIDAGISGKRIEAGLREAGLSPKDLSGICVTHEHTDHIGGLGVMARKYGIPIYTTRGTKLATLSTSSVGRIDEDLFTEVEAGSDFVIGDLNMHALPISHDAADPIAFLAKCGEVSMGVVTDLGIYTDAIVEKLQKMDILLLEANHDLRMLETGPYPYPLKRRIAGDFGHLSNMAAGQLLCRLLHDDFKTVILGHLSHENNYPELAYETVRSEVTISEVKYKGDDFPIRVASRSECSELFEV